MMRLMISAAAITGRTPFFGIFAETVQCAFHDMISAGDSSGKGSSVKAAPVGSSLGI